MSLERNVTNVPPTIGIWPLERDAKPVNVISQAVTPLNVTSSTVSVTVNLVMEDEDVTNVKPIIGETQE